MTKKLLTILLLTISTLSWAQDNVLYKYKESVKFFGLGEFGKAYDSFNQARPTNTQYPNTISNSFKKNMEIKCLHKMGDCLYYLGKLSRCIIDYRKALDLAKGIDDEMTYQILQSLLRVNNEIFDMQEIMFLSNEIDSLTKNTKDIKLKFKILGQLANDAFTQNNFALAERCHLERKTLLDQMSPDEKEANEYKFYQELENLYFKAGKFEKALENNQKYLEILKQKTSNLVSQYSPYYNMARIYAKMKEVVKTRTALDSLKYGYCKSNSSNNLANYHICAATIFEILSDYQQAFKEYEEALSLIEGFNNGSYNVFYNLILYKETNSLVKIGNFILAKDKIDSYLPFCRKTYGENSFEYAKALIIKADIEKQLDNLNVSRELYVESLTILTTIVGEQMKFVSIQQRESFWEKFSPTLLSSTAFALKTGSSQDDFTKHCYDALLFSKSLLLESDKTMVEAINQYCSNEEKSIFYELQAAKQRLDVLTKEKKQNNQQIVSIQQRISSLNSRLTPIISRLGYTSFLCKKYEDVKVQLDDDELLLDFADFVFDNELEKNVVYVINSKQDYPLLINCFTTEHVKNLLKGLPVDRLFDDKLGNEARKLLWNPISPHVAGKKTIYYVPSGILHQIALESIPMDDGSLLGEHYNFVRLTSAREIERYKSNMAISDKSNALLYGGLRYSIDDATMQIAAAKYDTPKLFAARGTLRGDSIFHELPYTLEEVTSTKKILDKRGVHAEVLSGGDGTEESFISLDGKAPQILHLSTHGFYYTPEQASDVAYLNGYKDAMALSGLILSGGNAAWQGKKLPKNVLGGVLTANTIARLDLKGVDLLFLAACQTGNGKVTPEGIYGLQRAFKKAGAKTIIMSLWDVDDKVAKEFSVRFYEELTKNGWNKRKAFEKAKSRIRKMKDCKEPFYWAGFVMLD